MSQPVQPLPHHPGLGVAVSMPGALACWQDTPRKDGEEHPETVGLRSLGGVSSRDEPWVRLSGSMVEELAGAEGSHGLGDLHTDIFS